VHAQGSTLCCGDAAGRAQGTLIRHSVPGTLGLPWMVSMSEQPCCLCAADRVLVGFNRQKTTVAGALACQTEPLGAWSTAVSGP
jgi:hypothetical protein